MIILWHCIFKLKLTCSIGDQVNEFEREQINGGEAEPYNDDLRSGIELGVPEENYTPDE